MHRHRVSLVSWLALTLLTAGFVVFVANADGQTVHRADLNDGGVWVTNHGMGIARQNKPIAQLDTYVPKGQAAQPDVVQDGAAVVQVDPDARLLTPVSSARGVAVTEDAVTVAGPAAMAGGTVAVVDPGSGGVWAARVDPASDVNSLATLDSETKPLATVGEEAVAAVATTGHVVTAVGSEVTTIAPAGSGFAEPETMALPEEPRDDIVGITAVGAAPAVLDGRGGVIVGEHRAEVAGGDPVLQQSGPSASEVIVAADGALSAVSREDGAVRSLPAGDGTPAAPVRVGACVFAVWGSGLVGQVVTACDGQDAVGPVEFDLHPGAELVFRVNRNVVVLNDVVNGTVWSVDGAKPVEISNWDAFQPKEKKKDESDDEEVDSEELRVKPEAKPDDIGARPSRTTTLHVLDNDLVSGGGVLTIVDVTQPGDAGAQVQMAPDRQALLLTLGANPPNTLAFEYTISDGSGGDNSEDSGTVTVTVRNDPGSARPSLREGYDEAEATTYPLAAGGSVEVSVVGDWRDPTYGDPVSVDTVDAGNGMEAMLTPDGLVRIQAAGATGRRRVTYHVSTGGESATGTVWVDVLARDSTETVAPRALPDVASGEVGGVVTLKPLDNDIPGADPSNVQARLQLSGEVTGPGVRTETDLKSGTVRVWANRPGSYLLKYTAGYGAARPAAGRIRVEVEPRSDTEGLPIAAPDTATVRGMAPLVTDVLANDYDPQGKLLAVLDAAPVDPESGLQVAVVRGQWLRISATTSDLTPATQAIRYTLSNGGSSVRGTVTVTQKDPLPSAENAPVPTDDEATVRVGDTAVVPVLDNDATPTGDPVGLRVPRVASDDLVAGELQVSPAVGKAYVAGRHVRYVAPEEIDGPVTVEVGYVAENTADPNRPSASGTLRVRLMPPPDEEHPNQVPTPRAIEARVVQGDRVDLQLPLVGNDPDGDSVSIVGIGAAPNLGRILDYGATRLVYQAFPGATGTDEFSYLVTDPYGETAEASVRVAVTRAGVPTPPVAVNDVITAAPGRHVEIDVLANDLVAPGSQVEILPLEDQPDGVSLDSQTGPILLEAPGADGETTALTYRISNGLAESTGELSVRAREGYNNPPLIEDAYATPDAAAAEVVVDVLATAYDIDGNGQPVTLDSVQHPDAAVVGGEVTLPVLDTPQVVPFRVVDGEGAAAAAAIYVPARPTGAPYLRDDAVVVVEPGETTDVALADIVADPEGDVVHLTTTDKIVAAPSDNLTSSAPDDTQTLRVAAGDATGPGAVTFEVSDRRDLGDPESNSVTLTVPVIVGDGDPVLSCPDEAITLVAGSGENTLDVAAVCHVWAADTDDVADLEFTAEWASGQALTGVTAATSDGDVTLDAAAAAVPGETGTLAIGIAGYGATDTLLVDVIGGGGPELRPMHFETHQVEPVTVDVARYATSPLGRQAEWVLIGDVTKETGPVAEVTTAGTSVTITPDEPATYSFSVTLSDDGDGTESSRPDVTGVITVVIGAPPEAPTNLRTDGITYDREVHLLWNAPASPGGAIEGYTVQVGGGREVACPGTQCVITDLDNGKEHTFRVRAHNAHGPSEWSNQAAGMPDRVPDAVADLAVALQRDKKISIRWQPPATAGDYSAITEYRISWPGGGIKTVGGNAREYVVPVPANGENTTISVWAVNDAGQSPQKATVTGMGAGKPDVPSMDTPETVNRAGNETKAVTISWGQVAANGPGPVEYTVTRTGGGAGKEICTWVQATSCADDLANDGTVYEYVVRARNQEATEPRETSPDLHVSANSSPVSVEAAARPDNITNLKVTATGTNKQAKVVFDVGQSHGKANRIECQPSCGTLQTSFGNNGASGVSGTVTPSGWTNGASETFSVRTCNDSNMAEAERCSDWISDPTVPYGPIPNPSLRVSVNKDCFNWSASGSGNGKTVTAKVTMSGSVIWQKTTAGGFSGSGTKCPGYSQTRSFKVTVTDSGATSEQPTKRSTKSAGPISKTTASAPPKATISQMGNKVSITLQSMGSKTYTLRCWNARPENYRWATDFRGEVKVYIDGSATFTCPDPIDPGDFTVEVLGHLWSNTIQWR